MLEGTAGCMCSYHQPQLRFQPTTSFHRQTITKTSGDFSLQLSSHLQPLSPSSCPRHCSRQSIPVLPVQILDPHVSSKHNKWLFYNVIYIYWEDSHKFTFTDQVGEEKERLYQASHSVMRLSLPLDSGFLLCLPSRPRG